jgi:hypothetical protein
MCLHLRSLGKVCGVSNIPCKMAFFVRTKALNSILTLENLIKRKMVVVNRYIMFFD